MILKSPLHIVNRSIAEEYHSFVNGQNTTQGGTHLGAFREAIVKTIKEFYNKPFEASDIRKSIVSAVAVKVEEPVFESQTKTKLGSTDIGPNGPSVRTFVNDFIKTKLDNFLHKNPELADALLRKILQAERERKELSGIRKLAKDRAKKSNLHNKKLRDCRVHLTDAKNPRSLESTLFHYRGRFGFGSITKSRDVNTQAVFSFTWKTFEFLRNVEENCLRKRRIQPLASRTEYRRRYGRFALQQYRNCNRCRCRWNAHSFVINHVFLAVFPELIKDGHLYILQTPLFRVQNKKETIYCSSDEERVDAIEKLKPKPEITRFKGLGEISPDEFKHFIGESIGLRYL